MEEEEFTSFIQPAMASWADQITMQASIVFLSLPVWWTLHMATFASLPPRR